MRKKSVINDKLVSYIEIGSGSPIVFLHGWGRTADDFLPLMEELKNQHRLIAIDLPGHGDSDEPSGDLSLDGLAKTLLEFFKLNEINNPILICHSFGARLAIKLASNGKVKNKLVFTGGAGIEKKSISYKLKVFNYKIMKLLVKTPFYSQYKEDLFANSGSVDYKNASPTMKKVLSLAVSEDLTHLLSKIDNEVLLYWGSEDLATPLWHGELMNNKIKKSKLISKQGLTHYAFLEDPIDFNNEVKRYIEGGYNE